MKKHFFINQLWAIEDEKNSIYVTPDEISISIDGDNLKLHIRNMGKNTVRRFFALNNLHFMFNN